MAQLNFDANTVDPNQAFDPVPAGWYTVQVTASEMKPTQNGAGAYLELEMTILAGEFKGRKLFDRLNLQNQNTTTVEIAYKTLSAICHATGVIQVQDSQQLHGIPMEAKAIVRPPANGYDASNDIRGYRAAGSGNGAPATVGAQPPVGMPPQQPAQPPAQPPQQPAYQPPAQPPQQPAYQQPQQPAPQQPPAQPAQQPQQPPANWGAPPAQEQQPAAQPAQPGHPTAGPAPSANGAPGAPPWGAPPQQ